MSEDAVPIRVLLVTVFESVIEVFLLCLAGYVLSRAGVTDKATQRKLNVINVSLFTPALLFSKVAFSLTPAKLKEMWIIPLGFVVITALSAAVAWTLSKIFKLKRSQRSFAICAAMFQNSNSLPIALIQSLVVEVPGLKWGHDDSKDQMLGRALTYLVLYSTLGMMLRWSWGVKLLSQADDEVPEVPTILPAQTAEPAMLSPEQMPHPGAQETDPFFTTAKRLTQDQIEASRSRSRSGQRSILTGGREASPAPSVTWTAGPGSAHSLHPTGQLATQEAPPMSRRLSNQSSMSHRKPPSRTESGREFWGLPEYSKPQKLELIDSADSSEDETEDEAAGENEEWGDLPTPNLRRRSAPTPPNTRFRSMLRKAKHKSKAILKSVNAFMTVPMYAALLSIFIAMIPPLQSFIGKIKPFEQAVKSAGQCSIPVTLVVLGAFFYAPPPHNPTNMPHNAPSQPHGNFFERKLRALRQPDELKAYPGENRAVFVAVISRMFIVPLLMLPFLAAIAKWDLFEAAEDPVFILAAVLLVSSPPALTLAQITQAASGDAFERLISKTITWSYAILTPPLTLAYVVIGLMFGRL